jgi:hypothetical protein
MRILKIAGRVFVFIILTILTQIGGFVYLLNIAIHRVNKRKVDRQFRGRLIKLSSFLLLYLVMTFAIVPFVARALGRVPLPLTTTNHLRPARMLTCFLNRNYVTTALRDVSFKVATGINQKYPGTVVNYLDASFPFINKFPLMPHLSHNDGKKVDFSFCYMNSKTGEATNSIPSIIGYGICEEPSANEINTPRICGQKGFWQYSMLKKIVPQGRKKDFSFNESKTADLINLFAEEKEVGKIFIEPHLKERLHLVNEKIRFQGCHAVRHDDHIHVQLK